MYENAPIPSSKAGRFSFSGKPGSADDVTKAKPSAAPTAASAGGAGTEFKEEERESPVVTDADMAKRLMKQPAPLAPLDGGKRKKQKQ